jgi:hypothetical protein
MSEEGKKLEINLKDTVSAKDSFGNIQDGQLAAEKVTVGLIKAFDDMGKVLIVFRDNMNKLQFQHIAKSLDSVLEHIGIDAAELIKMRERFEKNKEVKK